MVKTYEGKLEAKKFKFAIIVSRFNDFIVNKLLGGSMDALIRHGAEEKNIESTAEWLAEVPVAEGKEITDKIKAAADMGDVMQVASIAEELKSGTPSLAPFCDKIIQLADDFDFEGIQRFMSEFDS